MTGGFIPSPYRTGFVAWPAKPDIHARDIGCVQCCTGKALVQPLRLI